MGTSKSSLCLISLKSKVISVCLSDCSFPSVRTYCLRCSWLLLCLGLSALLERQCFFFWWLCKIWLFMADRVFVLFPLCPSWSKACQFLFRALIWKGEEEIGFLSWFISSLHPWACSSWKKTGCLYRVHCEQYDRKISQISNTWGKILKIYHL